MRKPAFCIYAKARGHTSCTVTAFVFASLYFLKQKYLASSLYIDTVAVQPGLCQTWSDDESFFP